MKAYLIEDEPHAQNALAKLVRLVTPQVEIIGFASTIEEAMELLKQQKPDFIFLDIKLGNSSAFELLKQVPPDDFNVLFVTAYNEFALEAFRWNAVHYITKPINSDDLRQGIGRIEQQKKSLPSIQLKNLLTHMQSKSTTKDIILRYDAIVEKQALSEIIRLEASGAVTFFYCLEEELLSNQKSVKRKVISSNIGQYASILPPNFYRCHQSHIVNQNFVRLYNKSENYLLLLDDTKVPVSRRGKEKIEEWLKLGSR
ncbi:MAG: LytTR family DNA-binding domain-containing protein [Bacteroidota bacterium]